jgi:hypothetical protein
VDDDHRPLDADEQAFVRHVARMIATVIREDVAAEQGCRLKARTSANSPASKVVSGCAEHSASTDDDAT